MQDTYLTIESAGEGVFKEKMSRFLSFAIPVSSVSEARDYIELYRKEYYDARHVCWAYMIGHERTCFRANDNGEPSGTAGKPILGQINSNNLTDILVVVVRYFGGIKLGTGGLIVAYRQAAAEAIAACNIVERLVEDVIHIRFEYPLMNDVMRVVKEEQPTVLSQSFEMDCEMSLRLRRSAMPRLCARLEKVQGLTFVEAEEPQWDEDETSDIDVEE
ncbi:MAG: YigZ family protein [Bacteroidaceae bacterium]|nr:YigZ family protein [Bacteroidaceae bacterium]